MKVDDLMVKFPKMKSMLPLKINKTKIIATVIVFLLVFAIAFLYTPSRWSSVEIFFDRSAEKAIFNLIKDADHQILIQMFSFTHEEIAQELERANARGVDVRVIIDDREENEHLEKMSFPVRWDGSSRLFHRKLAIFDAKWIWIGSTNWTYSGMGKNAEVDMLLASPDHALDLISQFEGEWRRSEKRRNK